MDLSRAEWRKSTNRGFNSCVEVAFVDEVVAIRDSKDQQGPVLVFTPSEWKAFIGGVCEGEFDLQSLLERALDLGSDV